MIPGQSREQLIKDVFDRLYQTLCVFAFSFVRDRAAAADIVQDSFVKFWERQQDLSNSFRNKSFLYLTVRNRCLNHIRDRKEQRVDLAEVGGEAYFRSTLIEDETYRLFYDAVEQLSPQSRKVIDLALEGLKNSEIAGHLGISESSVHSVKKIAYKKLRTALKDHYYLLLLFPSDFL